ADAGGAPAAGHGEDHDGAWSGQRRCPDPRARDSLCTLYGRAPERCGAEGGRVGACISGAGQKFLPPLRGGGSDRRLPGAALRLPLLILLAPIGGGRLRSSVPSHPPRSAAMKEALLRPPASTTTPSAASRASRRHNGWGRVFLFLVVWLCYGVTIETKNLHD